MRNVVLFGAGAAIPWNGPSTNYITKIFLNEEISGSRHCDYRPLRLIHDFLIYKFRQKKDYYAGFVNFEDLINVVEELILYYSDRSKMSRDYIPSIFKLSQELESDLSTFYRGENPFNFWKVVLNDILRTVTSLVNEYSYHYSGSDSKIFPTNGSHCEKEKSDGRIALNGWFKSWAHSLAVSGGTIRAYTLNYDRLFKELFQWALEAEVFEGVDNLDKSFFNLRSILKDRDVHCHYNLHGSIYWHPFEKSQHELNDWRFKLDKVPYWLSDHPEMPLITIEQGRSFLLSNIVAGYRKSQRTLTPPFKQINTSFEIDCCDGDNLYLIGYSFSDQHINSCVRSYIDKKSTLKIHIIDPKYRAMKNSEVLSDIVVTHLPQLFDDERLINGNHSPNEYPMSYLDGRVQIYPVTFEEYLKRC